MRSEKDLQDAVGAFLRKAGVPYIHARTDKASTIAVGWPDVTAFWNGRTAFCELKFGKGRLSPEQVECIKNLAMAGHVVCVTKDLSEACNHLSTALGLSGHAQQPPVTQDECVCGEINSRNCSVHANPEPAPKDTGPCLGYPEGSYQPLPKLWRAKSRDLGDVVLSRNPQTNSMGYVRLAKPEDINLPIWTGAL